MSPALHLTSNRIPGYGQSESGCLPCLGVYGKAAWKPPSPQSDCKTIFKVRTVSVKCSSRLTSFSCKASSNNPRRNPEFPRQNRHGFSRNRNRQNEERDSSENGEESEFLSMKNGPLLSLSHNNSRHQATAAPGPREREIVELFRKVQAQLRERMAAKEERKVDTSRGQSKERETVDSLLKLLRKHSIEHGKRKVDEGSSCADEGDKSRSFFNSDNFARDEPQELDAPPFRRPPSNFRRRSPISQVSYEPVISASETSNSVSNLDLKSNFEPEIEEPEPEPEVETGIVDGHLFGEIEDESSDADDPNDGEEQENEPKDLNTMKLSELRALAKTRGVKGFSKMKKSELVGLLSKDSV